MAKKPTTPRYVQPYRYASPNIPLAAIRRFARRVAERFGLAAQAFGSYAYGRPHVESDVDLLVNLRTKNEPDHAAATGPGRKTSKNLINETYRLIFISPMGEEGLGIKITRSLQALQRSLGERRKALKMPLDALARRSGVPRATLCRLLSGKAAAVSFMKVAAVAKALGVEFEFRPLEVEAFVDRQAERQARRLVGMVQGTMGLESQALDAEQTSRLVKKACRQLLAGPRKKLWVE